MVYYVDCSYDEDLSGDASFKRTEDATVPCFKIMGNETGALKGVSQSSDHAKFQNILLQGTCFSKIQT